MRFLLQVLAIAILAYILELVLPWYSVAIAAFACGFLFPTKLNFLAGFLGVAVSWLTLAMIIDSSSSSDLAQRVAMIFPVKEKYLLYLVMAVLGGLVGGFAAMAGGALKPQRR